MTDVEAGSGEIGGGGGGGVYNEKNKYIKAEIDQVRHSQRLWSLGLVSCFIITADICLSLFQLCCSVYE